LGYIDKNLTDGETVLYETRLHWIVMVRSIVVACVLVAVAAFLFFYAQTNASLDANSLHLLEAAGGICLIAAVVVILIGARAGTQPRWRSPITGWSSNSASSAVAPSR
jgi:hypothetical protein